MDVTRNAEGYPLNLLNEIAGGEWLDELPTDYRGTLEYIITETLTEREAQVIHLRYRDKMTFDNIAKELNMSRESIRRVKAKTIRKLRHPQRMSYLKRGMKGEIREATDKLTNVGGTLAELLQKPETVEVVKTAASPLSMPIDELDLSVRGYNVLYRAGILTLGNITDKSLEQLMKCRNMGKKTLDEIVCKVHSLGYRLKGEDENE